MSANSDMLRFVPQQIGKIKYMRKLNFVKDKGRDDTGNEKGVEGRGEGGDDDDYDDYDYDDDAPV
jgi:hypothetical protein